MSLRLVVLISGSGSNLQAILDACGQRQAGRHANIDVMPAQVVGVLSNRSDALGLSRAARAGVATATLAHTDFADRAAFDQAMIAVIDRWQPDVVVLAGFMRILTPAFVARYEGRLVNIHPSLLPAFAGLNTHQRAIDAGCKLAGATVHRVTPELDHGPILAQAAVPVLADDTAQTLGERVLSQEHLIYPRAIAALLRGS